MTGIAPYRGFAPGLSAPGPASSVIDICLRAQLKARQRGILARVFGVSPLSTGARSQYRTALRELHATTVFERLNSDFTVLTSSSSPAAGSAHLIVGPAGVFVVNTMSFSSKRIRVGGSRFLVNGRKNGCVAAARREALDAADHLSSTAGTRVEVTPLIVVVDSRSLSQQAPEVAVTEAARVARWFAGLPHVLSNDTIEYLAEVAGAAGGWLPSTAQSDDTQRHTQRFDRLRQEVEAAHHRAKIWSYAALSIVVGTGTGAVAATSFAKPLLTIMGIA